MRRTASVLAAGFWAACTPARDEHRATFALAPCELPGAGRPGECGTLEVPLDPAHADGERLGLRVAVLRAPRREPDATPLFLLAGGPGQAATEAFAAMLPAFAGIANDRDLVLVDQRGTGRSAPLDCQASDDLAEGFREGELRAAAVRCKASIDGRDLSQFSTERAADDLERVRAALGYEGIALYGVSYGTRLALRYAERHPGHARRLVLDGVAPPELVLGASFAKDSQASLDGLLAACAADESCRAAFPDARRTLDAHLERLEEAPANVEALHPRTGEPVHITMHRDPFAVALRGLLYAPELAALVPLTIFEVSKGRYGAFIAQAAALGEPAQEEMSFGLFLSVVCAEDVPRIEDAAVAESKATLFGDALIRELRGACEAWPVARLASAPAVTPELLVPTLILSGGLDPVTPPRWGELVAARIAGSRHLVATDAGHGIGSRSCVPKLMRAFLGGEPASGLDAACLRGDIRPPFFIDRAGPRQ